MKAIVTRHVRPVWSAGLSSWVVMGAFIVPGALALALQRVKDAKVTTRRSSASYPARPPTPPPGSPHICIFGSLSATELVHHARTLGGEGADAFVRQLCWRDFHHQAEADRELPHQDALRRLAHQGPALPGTPGGRRHRQQSAQLAVDGRHRHPPGAVFNPVLQAQRYDRDGVYVRRWIPELAVIEGPQVHERWNFPGLERLGYDYLEPIVKLSDQGVLTLLVG